MRKDIEIMGKYDDIIGLPHPVSKNHPQMSIENRAAQFAPFAALTGYDAKISEAGRFTEGRMELDEQKKNELDEAMGKIVERLGEKPWVYLTYFVEDEIKAGGRYVSERKQVLGIDVMTKVLKTVEGDIIKINDIYELELEKA